MRSVSSIILISVFHFAKKLLAWLVYTPNARYAFVIKRTVTCHHRLVLPRRLHLRLLILLTVKVAADMDAFDSPLVLHCMPLILVPSHTRSTKLLARVKHFKARLPKTGISQHPLLLSQRPWVLLSLLKQLTSRIVLPGVSCTSELMKSLIILNWSFNV